MNNLLSLVKQSKPGVVHEFLTIGKFQFNTSRYELKFRDQVRKLSHREANLLSMLAQNQNGTTQRKDILMQLWGDDSFFNSRTLDVYITKLRDYLKEDPSIEIITIKGVGYHFAVG